MAPLFGQRQKVPEDLATTTNQSQAFSYSNAAPGTSGGVGNIHFTSAPPGSYHHQEEPSNLQNDLQAARECVRNSVPPPLPPLRQTGPNDRSASDTTAIRKYLVLLQDCLAIKFAPLVNGHQSHPYPFAFNGTARRKNGIDSTPGVPLHDDEDDDLLASHRSPIGNPYNRQVVSNDSGNAAKCGSNSITAEQLASNRSSFIQSHRKSTHHPLEQFLQSSSSTGGGATRPSSTNGAFLGSSTAEVDHSLHALYLYKGFKEANAQCHWNSALSATFQNIQYKGYIVPSTILVGALPKFLSILRTAWSRQMLRSPAGYRIEFIGEIEEVIADPIQKGQFAPLSDSLCWAILELTSLGQEAFVDSIMSALQLSFPTMSCPSRELVFQTLEKLIKDRKVYQTSRGYFVVTPDIFRYMVAANFHEFDGTLPFMANQQGMTLDALLHPNCPDQDKMSFSHQSWDSATSTGDHNRCSPTSTGEDLIEVAPSPKLKRHNSLKLIRQRDVAVTQMSGSTGHRRYSLRLPKSKSCGRMNDTVEDDEEVKRSKGKSSTIEHISRAMRSLRTATIPSTASNSDTGGDCEKSKKNKSLLSKLFPFRRSTSKPRNEKITPATVSAAAVVEAAAAAPSRFPPANSTSVSDGSMSPPTKTKHSENAKESAKFISTQTQTSNSTEQLCVPSPITLPSSVSPQQSSHPGSSTLVSPPATVPTAGNEKIPGRVTAVDSTQEHSSVDVTMLHHPSHHIRHHHNPDCIGGGGEGSHQTRSSSRRSMSILDESPLYDVLQDVPSPGHNSAGFNSHLSPNFQVGCPVAPPTFPAFHHHRGESSRCSTLSSQAASSLGYGSQGHPSLTSNYSPHSAYGYYAGEGSVGSHSPCGQSPTAHYGCAHNRNDSGHNNTTSFPQPPKPSAYSSARYKNSYEWYKKRYPNYISPVGRSSPLYASLTAPRSKSRSRPTYESLLAPMDGKHGGGGGLIQVSGNRGCTSSNASQETANNNKMNGANNMLDPNQENSANRSTTTVTQAVKSTTNMEMQLLLPLGKIMKAALQAKKDAIRDAWLRDELGPGYAAYVNKNNADSSALVDNNEPIKVNLDNSGAKLRVGEPTTKTEVTTVVNNNGVIETHFDSSSGINQPDLSPPNLKSTVEIKTLGGVTDIVLVNGKTGKETKLMSTAEGSNSYGSNERATLDKGKSYKKVNDIGKDCVDGKDVIKVC